MLIKSALNGIFVFFLTVVFGTSAAANLQVSNGILTGAKNIDINGKKYDVSFTDGLCAELFDGCKGGVLPFATSGTLAAADQALLDQVFIDGPLGLFDSHPELTKGCTLTRECSVLTPVQYWNPGAMIYSLAANLSANDPYGRADYIGATPFIFDTDFAAFPYYTFAVFTESDTLNVPEPSTVVLFLLASLLMTLTRHQPTVAERV